MCVCVLLQAALDTHRLLNECGNAAENGWHRQLMMRIVQTVQCARVLRLFQLCFLYLLAAAAVWAPGQQRGQGVPACEVPGCACTCLPDAGYPTTCDALACSALCLCSKHGFAEVPCSLNHACRLCYN